MLVNTAIQWKCDSISYSLVETRELGLKTLNRVWTVLAVFITRELADIGQEDTHESTPD